MTNSQVDESKYDDEVDEAEEVLEALHIESDDPVVVALQNALRAKNKKVKDLEVSSFLAWGRGPHIPVRVG
jgi:hypothetical protein